jgi:glycosyltransferase involved in cell wall biosynthesis
MIEPRSQGMRHILYVWNYREWGGAQIYFLSLMKEAKRSLRVTALLPSNSEPKIVDYLKSIDIPIEFLPPAPVLNTGAGMIAKLSRRISILRSEIRLANNILARDNLRDLIVHIDLGFWQSSFALFRLCRKTNVFVTVHTGLPIYSGWRALRWKIKGKSLSLFSSFHLLASNNEAKDSLKPYLDGNKFGRTEVTYSGIDPLEITKVSENLPNKTQIRQQYRIAEHKALIITVGQFIERKGCWVLLESLRQLKEAGKDFAFVWLSTTSPNEEALIRINGFRLEESFRLMDADEIGHTRDALLTLLSAADIFVLASLQEGLPIALTEAMALGLPCIATSVNAIPEALEDGHNGIVVPPNDPKRLTESISTLLNDPRQREVLGRAAKKTAFEKFNAEISAARTMKLYNDVWNTRD